MRPTRHPTFDLLPTPALLRVPLTLRSSVEPPPIRPIGTKVLAGERLVESVSQFDHWPLAPVAAEIRGTLQVTLTSGRVVHGVELATIGALPAGPERSDGTEVQVESEVVAAPTEQSGDSPPPTPTTSTDIVPLPTAPSESDRGGWIDRLRDAGVWIDRWTSPNLLAQLHESLRRPIDTVVCSVLDGDPNMPIGAAIASQKIEQLIAGVRLITRLSGASKAVVVMQQRLLPDVVAAVKKAGGMTALEIVNDYPQADPSILLATLMKRKLRPGRLPSDQGVLLLDAVAAVAVGRVVVDQQPMLAAPIALYNHSRNTTHLALMPVGSSLDDLLEARQVATGGFVFRGGDVLRDRRIPREAIIGGGEIALHASPGPRSVNPDPCIRCGWCVEACPSNIHPAGLLDSAQRRDPEAAEYYGIAACVECGLCDYVCPSRLPILMGIRGMRTKGGKTKDE